ncbi:hypothetical protein OHA25_60640 (plasmid) [Nonomuraea sp. NBC_00507]|uniref:hypothetical protein n=1 Tax=Nonomuraea sp. NBC_00507 TaxID=2976002 RepID=UPI002E192367
MKSKKPSVKIRRRHPDETTCTHKMTPGGKPRPGQGCPGGAGYEAACDCGCGWKKTAGIRAIVEEQRTLYLANHPYEYAVRHTDQLNDVTLAYNPEIANPFDRADAWARAGCLRTWQEDRLIEKDATLMRRQPGQEWEDDPVWAAELAAYARLCAQVEAAFDADDPAAIERARGELAAWVDAPKRAVAAGRAK